MMKKEEAEDLTKRISELLTNLIPFGKVFTYVEANPPSDEVEEYITKIGQ